MKRSKLKWRKYLLEFLTIFIGVTLAFALTKWNEDRNRYESSEKTLLEIKNGLELDLTDFNINKIGHKRGISACNYFRAYLREEPIKKDSIDYKYRSLLRDLISIQNMSGYESLKSKGLELVENDSLRLEIITLYDFYYEALEKLEETYSENQFYDTYHTPISEMLAEYMVFDKDGRLVDLSPPIGLSKKEKNLLMHYLWKIEWNRNFTNDFYLMTEKKVKELIKHIEENVK